MFDSTIVPRITQLLAEGKSKEAIYLQLLSEGFKVDDLHLAYEAAAAPQAQADLQKRTIRIVVLIGAILIGAGIFSFIAANWEDMPRFFKIMIILVSMSGSYAAGWHAKEKANFPRLGEAFFLLGTIIYGAGIFLVAQMFHIRSNWPDGFLLWMLGGLAVAYAMELMSIFVFSWLVGAIAIVGHPYLLFSDISYSASLFTPTSLLVVATAATLYTGWQLRKRAYPEIKELF